MTHLVDSDIVIDHLDDVEDVTSLLDRLASDGIAISIITYFEVREGRFRAPDPATAHWKFDVFLDTVPVILLSISAADECARLRDTLRRQGRRVRPRALDLITAAIAIEHDLTLITRNTADYADIPGLKLFEW